jgi:hypothetical protein
MSTSPKQRLQELKDLLDAGRIDDAEYASLRQSALNDLGMPPRGAIAAQGGGTDAGYGKGDMLGSDDRGYKLVRPLGQGGMGQVWLAEDLAESTNTGRTRHVALKLLPKHLTQDKRNADLLLTEAQRVRELRHPHIVAVYDWRQDLNGGGYFLVMEHIAGQTLDQWLAEHRRCDWDHALDIVQPIAQALEYAWREHQVVHRDLKPANVMLTEKGVVKLLDFGIAAQSRSTQSRLGVEAPQTAGTLGYRAPEASVNPGKPQPALDVYALAVMVYELLEGSLPFDGERTRHFDPDKPAGLSAERWRVLLAGLSFMPQDRGPATALALVQALVRADATQVAAPVATPVAAPVAAPVADPPAASSGAVDKMPSTAPVERVASSPVTGRVPDRPAYLHPYAIVGGTAVLVMLGIYLAIGHKDPPATNGVAALSAPLTSGQGATGTTGVPSPAGARAPESLPTQTLGSGTVDTAVRQGEPRTQTTKPAPEPRPKPVQVAMSPPQVLTAPPVVKSSRYVNMDALPPSGGPAMASAGNPGVVMQLRRHLPQMPSSLFQQPFFSEGVFDRVVGGDGEQIRRLNLEGKVSAVHLIKVSEPSVTVNRQMEGLTLARATVLYRVVDPATGAVAKSVDIDLVGRGFSPEKALSELAKDVDSKASMLH